MSELNGDILLDIDVFLLVLVRMTGLFVIVPVFGRQNVPSVMKAGFAFFSALILVNSGAAGTVAYSSFAEYALIIVKEFAAGAGMGFVVYMVFSAIYVAGQLIDMQIGFGMVNVLDPVSNIQVPITANFYYIFSMLVFLMVKGHYMVIRALYDSFKVVPLNKTIFRQELPLDLIRVFGDVFITGFKIAAPITAAILMANIALGVMARAVPHLNIFILGMPVKIIVGIFIILASIPLFVELLGEMFDSTGAEMERFFRYIGP